jgi:DNA-binding LacI/PurR family transcriptional regulator
MIVKRTSEKLNHLTDFLREQVSAGKFAPGERLPSLRALMSQFDLSYGSVKRGIDLLCEMGLVEKRAGSGTFVKRVSSAAPCAAGAPRLAVFMTDEKWGRMPGIFPTVFLGIQKAAQEAGVSLLVNYVRRRETTAERIVNLTREVDGVLLLGEYDATLPALGLNIPAVGVCMHETFATPISIVDIDPFLTAEQAVAYFRQNGKDKVAVVSSKIPAYRNRGRQFAMLWESLGLAVERVDARKHILFQPERGYLFTTGSVLQAYSQTYLSESGKPLAEDMTVLGIDGKTLVDPSFHKAPSIALDWQQVGRCAFDECLRRIRQPGSLPRRLYLPGQLHRTGD